MYTSNKVAAGDRGYLSPMRHGEALMTQPTYFLVRVSGVLMLFRTDPRPDGFQGDVEDGITLLPLPNRIDDYRWDDGQPRPEPRCHGRDRQDRKVIREFC